jgi:hypothetical protein
MRGSRQREIVVNGIRYNVAIRLDANWSYTEEWWNDTEYHKRTRERGGRSTSDAERDALDNIYREYLELEPWMRVEIVRAGK